MGMFKKTTMASAFMLILVAPVWAQSGTAAAPSSSTDTSATHTAQDVQFVTAASAAGQTEIMASRLAATHSKSANIKSFATTMIHDHTNAANQLKAIAQKGGYTLASAPTATQQADLAKLQPLHGKDFDTAYAAMMVSDHRDAVSLFQTESTSGNNDHLKSFATKTLPTLQHHLSMATAL